MPSTFWTRQGFLFIAIAIVAIIAIVQATVWVYDLETGTATGIAPAAPCPACAYTPKLQISIDPTTHWQPRQGMVKINVAAIDPTINLTAATFEVDFRWSRQTPVGDWTATDVTVAQFDSPKKIVLAATVPQLPEAPGHSVLNIDLPSEGIGTFLGLVPQADVRIKVTVPGDGKTPAATIAEETMTIGVTSLLIAILAALITVFAIFEMLYLLKPKSAGNFGKATFYLQLIATKSGHASLSQFQIMLWTVLIGTAVVFVMALSGNLIPITQGTLTLLGISGIATLGAQYKAQTSSWTAQPALAIAPSWGDLIKGDDGTVDVTRVQMFFFTVLVAIFVVIHVLDNYEIPPVPESFQALMGISNGIYIVSKFVPNTQGGASQGAGGQPQNQPAGSPANTGLAENDAMARLAARNIKLVGTLTQNADGSWTGLTQAPSNGTQKVMVMSDGTVTVEV